jgi:hypothetical protein
MTEGGVELNGRMHGPLWKFLDWLIPPALAILGWTVMQVVEMRATRFTTDDGARAREYIHENAIAVGRMQDYVSALQANNDRWLEHHEKTLDSIERLLERHLESSDPHKESR